MNNDSIIIAFRNLQHKQRVAKLEDRLGLASAGREIRVWDWWQVK